MAKTLFVFLTICKDPAREQELSDWYDKIHIPDVEAVPGVLSCRRYRICEDIFNDVKRPDGGVPKYISIVESSDAVEVAKTRLRQGVEKWAAAKRISLTPEENLFEVISEAVVTIANPPSA